MCTWCSNRSVPGRLAPKRLSLHLGAAPVPLKQWSLTTPIQSTSLGSYEYREILREIQASFSVEGVVISTLIGHSLDVYDLPIADRAGASRLLSLVSAALCHLGEPLLILRRRRGCSNACSKTRLTSFSAMKSRNGI